jgi:hypothetical protein
VHLRGGPEALKTAAGHDRTLQADETVALSRPFLDWMRGRSASVSERATNAALSVAMVADGLSNALSKYAWPSEIRTKAELHQVDRRVADFVEKLEQLIPNGQEPQLGTTDPRAVTTLARALEDLLSAAERYNMSLRQNVPLDGSYSDESWAVLSSSKHAAATLLAKLERHTGPSKDAALMFAVQAANEISLAQVWASLATIPEMPPARLQDLRSAAELVAGTEGTLTIQKAQAWASALSSPDAQAHVLARIGHPEATLAEAQNLGDSLVVALIRLMNARQI